jgi:hypothetical protein
MFIASVNMLCVPCIGSCTCSSWHRNLYASFVVQIPLVARFHTGMSSSSPCTIGTCKMTFVASWLNMLAMRGAFQFCESECHKSATLLGKGFEWSEDLGGHVLRTREDTRGGPDAGIAMVDLVATVVMQGVFELKNGWPKN